MSHGIIRGLQEPIVRASRVSWLYALGALLLFLLLAIAFSLTRCPWWDEGLFADVAVTFRNAGHFGSSLLAPYNFANMPAVDRYTYWQFPTYLVSLGLWFHLGPVSVLWMRLFSVLCGCFFAAAWFLFVRGMSHDETLALLVASVAVLDYSCVAAASNGRMDMLCAALGQASLAAYVFLRESRMRWAALSAGLFGAASLFCHPMGIVTNAFLGLLLLSDWRRWRWNHVSLLAFPYFVGAALWLRYILEAPSIFLAQAKGISGYRLGGLLFMLGNIASDFHERYLRFYFAPHSGSHQFKLFSVLFGIVGVMALLLNRKTRAQTLTRLLLLFVGVGYLGVAAIDNQKFPYYLVYVTPALSACGALWLYESFRNGSAWRWAAAALLAAYILATVAGSGYYIHRNDWAKDYRPMVESVRSHLHPGSIVMGPSELDLRSVSDGRSSTTVP